MADSAWPADTVERWPLERLIGYARNAKTHPPEQVARIAASIREFGWTIPVLVDEAGTLIAGHGRVLAARQLGLSDIPTMVARGWTDAQVKAYRLADNKLTESAWDNDLLALELRELSEMEFDVSLTGFDEAEVSALSGDGDPVESSGGLAADFLLPPFSVLSARDGWWQSRKRAWIALGIRSELGRGEAVTYGDSPEITEHRKRGGSIGAIASNEKGDNGILSSPGKYAAKASPGGSPRPACDYSKSKARGDGAGKPVKRSGP